MVKCIEDGKIALYEQKRYNYGQTPDNALGAMATLSSLIIKNGIPNIQFTSWYIEKDGCAIAPIKHNTFASIDGKTRRERKTLLGSLLGDSSSEEIYKSTSFSFNTIRLLIRKYNAKY